MDDLFGPRPATARRVMMHAAYTFVPRLGNIDALPATLQEAA